MHNKKKMGIITEFPKPTQIYIRFDKKTADILDEYCIKEQICKTEGIRRAVKGLKTQQ